jgi:hypothetical protein
MTKLDQWEHRLTRQHLMAVTNNDMAIKNLLKLRTQFSSQVVKSMLNSFVSWQGTIPTSLEDLPGHYSPTTGLFDIPRAFLQWQTQAINDSSILNDQVNSIRQLEVYEKFWGDFRDRCVKELQRIKTLREAIQYDQILTLHKKLLKLN